MAKLIIFFNFYLEDTKEIIEIKPFNLQSSSNNLAKFNKAKEIYGDKFIIKTEKDVKQLIFKEIKELVVNGDLIFLDRYYEKFLTWGKNDKKINNS